MSRESWEQKRIYGKAAVVIGLLITAVAFTLVVIAEKEIGKLDQFILRENK